MKVVFLDIDTLKEGDEFSREKITLLNGVSVATRAFFISLSGDPPLERLGDAGFFGTFLKPEASSIKGAVKELGISEWILLTRDRALDMNGELITSEELSYKHTPLLVGALVNGLENLCLAIVATASARTSESFSVRTIKGEQLTAEERALWQRAMNIEFQVKNMASLGVVSALSDLFLDNSMVEISKT